MNLEALRGFMRRAVEGVEAEIRAVERELAEAEREARRGKAEARRRAAELSAIRDILYEDKWFRVATAAYAHVKRHFAEDGKAGEIIKAAKRRLSGLRLEEISMPLLKIEAAVDSSGNVTAVRCRAALDLGVETLFEGTAPGFQPPRKKTGPQAGAGRHEEGREAASRLAKGETGGGGGRATVDVELLVEEVRREFAGLPVYVGVEDGLVYVKRTAPMDQRQFRRYTETCKRLGFKYDRRGKRWVKPPSELITSS
jgi:hypothetical protein